MTDNLDRIGKLFILYMEKDGTFKPSQILKFNATDGYDVIVSKTNMILRNMSKIYLTAYAYMIY
jgi:hypothetical protein